MKGKEKVGINLPNIGKISQNQNNNLKYKQNNMSTRR